MTTTDNLQKIRSLAEQVAAREGCRIYDIQFVAGSKGKGRTLRVYIDKAADNVADNKPASVSIDDCANVSRGLNLLLDVEDMVPGGGYSLEVSTPGLDRLLREKWHFESVIGKKINVKTIETFDHFVSGREDFKVRKQMEAVLAAANDEGIALEWQGVSVPIPYASIHKAYLIFEFEKNEKPNKKK